MSSNVRKPFVRSLYNYDRDMVSTLTGLHCMDESRTVQSEKEDTDINEIVRRFGLTGHLPENVRVPSYGDFSEVVDFQTAQNVLIEARNAFLAMPSKVRNRFGNDPALFVEFCQDPQNIPEMVKMGLAVPVQMPDNKGPDGDRVEVSNGPVKKRASKGATKDEGSGEDSSGE